MENSSFDTLEAEVEFYRKNHTEVEQEIKNLIEDNQKLSQQVGTLLKEKLENARMSHDHDNYKENIENMKRQVTSLAKERDSLHVLWQTSQKTIEALETELNTYQGFKKGDRKHPCVEKRDLNLKLETAIGDYVELESKFKETQTNCNRLEDELKIKEKEITSYKERGKELETEIKELQRKLEEFKINLIAEKRSNEELKNNLSLSRKENVDLVKKEAEAKSKVAEALQLYDYVASQKNEAYKKIAEITEEMIEVKQKLANVRDESEKMYKSELNELKEKYNEKVTDMLEHIKNLDTELVEKGLLLNKILRENQVLRNEVDNYLTKEKESRQSLDPKLLLAEQRLEAMFEELVASEKRNMQIVCEKQCLAVDLHRVQDEHAREIKRRDWEEKLLRTKCDELKMQVEHMQKSLDETHNVVNKLQTMLSSRTELTHKMVSTKEEEITELNKHLQNQMELSSKWKDSYVEMNEKLKNKIEKVEKENDELKLKLNLLQTQGLEYDNISDNESQS